MESSSSSPTGAQAAPRLQLRHFIIITAACLAAAAALAFSPPEALERALSRTDVVRIYAQSSYREMAGALPAPPLRTASGGWTLQAPDASVSFVWEPVSGGQMLSMIFPAEPFLAAGMDPARLPEGFYDGENIVLSARVQDGGGPADAGAEESFLRILEANRDRIGYHQELDHFEVSLGGGSRFEWARNIDANDKDLVFVVDPAIFLAAGTQRDQVAGWIYGAVFAPDEYGRSVPQEKFLKPFDLR